MNGLGAPLMNSNGGGHSSMQQISYYDYLSRDEDELTPDGLEEEEE
jgi:hypothetical protein